MTAWTDRQKKKSESRTKITYSYLDVSDGSSNTVSDSKAKVHAGEPIFVNPNSHASVLRVLQEIGRQVQTKKYVPGGEREWEAITCDGLPFYIAQRVMKETFSCLEHSTYQEVTSVDLPTVYEFDWVLLRIGHGHVEMNMVRSFFALNWEVCIKDLDKCMGFCSGS